MSSRTWKQKLGSIWGSTATAASGAPVIPAQGTAYRRTDADSASPDPGYLSGLKYLTKAPSEILNQALFNLTSALDDLQQSGTLLWDTTVPYAVGSMCHGSDGFVYVCLTAQNGTTIIQDPITDSSATYWRKMHGLGNSLLAETGYQRLASGLTFQWGKTGVIIGNSGAATVTFPTPFLSMCVYVNLIGDQATSYNAESNPSINSRNATGFTFVNHYVDSVPFIWFALGF